MVKSSSKAVILTSLVCATLVLMSAIGAWVYIQQQDGRRTDSKEQATRECSGKILPRAAEDYKYAEYEKCMANRGYDVR